MVPADIGSLPPHQEFQRDFAFQRVISGPLDKHHPDRSFLAEIEGCFRPGQQIRCQLHVHPEECVSRYHYSTNIESWYFSSVYVETLSPVTSQLLITYFKRVSSYDHLYLRNNLHNMNGLLKCIKVFKNLIAGSTKVKIHQKFHTIFTFSKASHGFLIDCFENREMFYTLDQDFIFNRDLFTMLRFALAQKIRK